MRTLKKSLAHFLHGLGSRVDVRDDLEDLKAAHKTLLAEYVRVLKSVSLLPCIIKWDKYGMPARVRSSNEAGKRRFRLRRRRKAGTGLDIFTWRILTRLFAEFHIRRQLSALFRAYVFEQRALDRPADQREWLQHAEESCSAMLTALSSGHRIRTYGKALLAALGPAAAGVAAAMLGADDIWHGLVDLPKRFRQSSPSGAAAIVGSHPTHILGYIGFSVVVIYSVYLVLPIRNSFSYMRDLMFPGVYIEEFPKQRLQRIENSLRHKGMELRERGANVYALEDKLFALLNTGKRCEPRVDITAQMIVGAALILGASFIPARLYISWRNGTLLDDIDAVAHASWDFFTTRRMSPGMAATLGSFGISFFFSFIGGAVGGALVGGPWLLWEGITERRRRIYR